jgi:hypothetical protein
MNYLTPVSSTRVATSSVRRIREGGAQRYCDPIHILQPGSAAGAVARAGDALVSQRSSPGRNVPGALPRQGDLVGIDSPVIVA